jgi:hypothetical protein
MKSAHALQRLAASRDHLAVPVRQFSLVADAMRQTELQHVTAKIVIPLDPLARS